MIQLTKGPLPADLPHVSVLRIKTLWLASPQVWSLNHLFLESPHGYSCHPRPPWLAYPAPYQAWLPPLPLPASASELQKVGGEITEHRRVSSQNTAAPPAPSGLSPAVWYLAPADSQSPSPQQLFQTFPSPRAPDCVAPSLTDDLTSYMTEEMEASQLQLPAHSSSPRKHCGHPALAVPECQGGGITTRPSRTQCQQQPLLSGIKNPSCNSFLLLVLAHAHSLPHCFFISLPTWGQVTWQLHFSPPTDLPPFTLSPP